MDILKIFAILVVTAFISLILKQQKSDMHYLVSITGIVVAGIIGIRYISPAIELFKSFDTVSSDVMELLLKVLGISYLTDFSVSICKELGENGLAAGAELCGKAEILILALPLFSRLLDICTKLLN
jgi:stage III sporulation protein AD